MVWKKKLRSPQYTFNSEKVFLVATQPGQNANERIDKRFDKQDKRILFLFMHHFVSSINGLSLLHFSQR